MTTILNLALLLVGTAATLAAFGGETWSKGSEPLIERITPRGWISVACLMLAFALGAGKEVNSEKQSRKAADDAAATKDQLNKDLGSSRIQLAIANEQLKRLESDLKFTQERLGDMKHSLADVRETLGSTRTQLTVENDANLLTALTNAKNEVSYASVMVDFAPGTPDRNREALFSDQSAFCREISTGVLSTYFVDLDLQMDRTYLEKHSGKTSANFGFIREHSRSRSESEEPTLGGIPTFLADGTRKIFFVIDEDLSKEHYSAAQAYNDASPGKELVSLSVRPKYLFADKVTAEAFSNAHPELGGLQSTLSSKNGPTFAFFNKYPSSCSAKVETYWHKAIESIKIEYLLSGEPGLMFIYKLRALEPEQTHRETKLQFVVTSPPDIKMY